MAESKQHKQLVRCIVSYLESMPDCYTDLIEADLENYNTRTTKVVGGYYPDVFYKDSENIYIGEAKTENDLINLHSKNQLNSYIDEVNLFYGRRNIIVSVPYFAYNTLYNYINCIIEQRNVTNITFHLLSENLEPEKICL